MHKQAILLITAIAISLWWSCKEEVKYLQPQYESLSESVYASVTVQAEDLYTVYAAATGILEKMVVEEGDLVQSGQLIARIDADNPRIAVENAQVNLDLAAADLKGQSTLIDNIKNQLEAAQMQLQIDSVNYFRQKRLWEKGIGAKVELDNRKLKFELSQNQVVSLQNRLIQTRRDLKARYQQSQNQVKSARTSVNDFSVYSKMDGRVYQLFKNEGEVITLQTPLAAIGRANRFLLEMDVDEVDIPLIELGQQVLVRLDAYDDTAFPAKVSRIYPQKNVQKQTFLVEAKFVQAPDKLFPGLSGEANILLQQKEKTLTIPAEYLSENETVFTTDGEVSVKTGIRNLEKIEILSGIDTSSLLLKPR